jgi:hypothetical protein
MALSAYVASSNAACIVSESASSDVHGWLRLVELVVLQRRGAQVALGETLISGCTGRRPGL